VNNAADAKLENTSLSTGVVQGSSNDMSYLRYFELLI